jgi:SpoVK/Ycf46/Vps4 family AAA+-type ATPase
MTPLASKIQPFTDALYPIIYIHSYEELKMDEVIRELADGNIHIDEWNLTRSESLIDFLEPYVLGTEQLDEVFIVLKDAHSFLDKHHPENQKIVAMLKKIVNKILADEEAYGNIIIVSPILTIPEELEKYVAVFNVDLPTYEEIKLFILEFAKAYDEKISPEDLEKFATYLRGLTEREINILLNMSIQNDGKLGGIIDETLILNEKKQIIKKSGILEMIDTRESLDSIGGLENIKQWLTKKAAIFKNIKKAREYGVDTPKGVFIVGMPGCGKSLTAKATALLFDNIPLLRLDIGRLMGKYVGESESNMRKAIAQAEAISPSILWIDEIEKAFTGIGKGGSGSEVATRLFGFFLTWMQEKTSDVYVIATANDISNLPPELLRKGRFDEVFFVDFPKVEERKQIFEVHIKNRKFDPIHWKDVDINALANKTEGYSGADIETVVKETIEEAFFNNKAIASTADYLATISDTVSISDMLADQVRYYKETKQKLKIKPASK